MTGTMLDPETRAALEREAMPLKAPAGTVLFRPGDACSGFLILHDGRVRVDLVAEDGHALLLYRVTPGEACAITTSCLFAAETYSAEGRAETAISGLLLPVNVNGSVTTYNTADQSFLKVQFNSTTNVWSAWAKDGTLYTFNQPVKTSKTIGCATANQLNITWRWFPRADAPA